MKPLNMSSTICWSEKRCKLAVLHVLRTTRDDRRLHLSQVEMVRVQEDMLSAQYTTKDCLYHRNLQWFAGG